MKKLEFYESAEAFVVVHEVVRELKITNNDLCDVVVDLFFIDGRTTLDNDVDVYTVKEMLDRLDGFSDVIDIVIIKKYVVCAKLPHHEVKYVDYELGFNNWGDGDSETYTYYELEEANDIATKVSREYPEATVRVQKL